MAGTSPLAGQPEEAEPDEDWGWTDEHDGWVPPSIDVKTPSVARMYDYYLGGKDNFEVDRMAAEQALKVVPDGRDLARSNRTFLLEAVRSIARRGVEQFIDLGTGIPASPNVHETAREVRPATSVAYVDNDPIVLAYGRALLAGVDRVVCVSHDLRRPQDVLADEQVRAVLDFGRPIGLLLVAVLHFIEHDLAVEIVSRYRDAIPSGSWLAISCTSSEGVDPEVIKQVQGVYRNSTASLVVRSRAQIEQLFEGFELDGGLVDIRTWLAEPATGQVTLAGLCGIARKP